MKKISYLLALYVLLTAFQCEECDDCGGEYISITQEDLITISESNYHVNDTIWIETAVPKIMTKDNGETINLKELDAEHSYSSNFYLKKLTAYGYSDIYLNENTIVSVEGETPTFTDTNYPSVNTHLIYNSSTESYNSKFGIVLLESGDYLIKPTTDYNQKINISFSSATFYIDIFTTIANRNLEESYQFTVAP